jgi:hypothetical protein
MSISTYFRLNIHQNSPEILGVKKNYLLSNGLKVVTRTSSLFFFTDHFDHNFCLETLNHNYNFEGESQLYLLQFL